MSLVKAISPVRPATSLMLGLAVALTATLRLYGINFGLPALLNPDELMFELGAIKMIVGGAMNPEWFGHPATTTIYILALVNIGVFLSGLATGEWSTVGEFTDRVFTDPGIIILPGRIAMVLFAVATVILTYRLGQRLFGNRAGLVAAFLLALSPLHITWSQVIRSDIMATFFMVATMLAALSLLENGRRRDLVLACMLSALAITSKWPFAVSLVSIFGALSLRWHQDRESSKDLFVKLGISTVLCALLILCISPYLLIDHLTVMENLRGEAQQHHLGATGNGLISNIWFYLSGPIWTGLGPVAVLFALFGLTKWRTQANFWAIAGIPTVAMLILISSQNLTWDRWAIVLIPVIAILAGTGVDRLFKLIKKLSHHATLIAAPVFAVAMFIPLLLTIQAEASERINDNRRQASDWARANLPPDTTLLVEHFAFDLADAPLNIIFPIGIGGCFDARALLEGRIDYAQVDSLRGGNSNLDYGAIPDEKLPTCAADYAIITEYTRYEREKSSFKAQHYRYQELLMRSDILARFPAVPSKIGGRSEVIIIKIGTIVPRQRLIDRCWLCRM